MQLYAVFQEGVYRHGCAGIFDNFDIAKRVADGLADIGDGYHNYDVVPFEMNRPSDFEVRGGQEEIDEPAHVYRTSRNKPGVGGR